MKFPKSKRSVSIASYAKINLFLDVIRKRADGYHEIDTVFQTINLHDSLIFVLTKKAGIEISSNIPELADENNLVYKIASRILTDFNIDNGLKIELEKKIPIAAGLGGGSSNAAVTILALNKLFGLQMSQADMYRYATEYGSDINFFLLGGRCRGKDRGQEIIALPDATLWDLLLVNPHIKISSKEAYSLVNIEENHQTKRKYWFNKLEKGIVNKYPVIGSIIRNLKLHGALHSMMSGSGSTCFGVFTDKNKAKEAENFFQTQGMWTLLTNMLGRKEYQRCIQNLS